MSLGGTASNWDGGVAPTSSLTANIARFNQASYPFAPTLSGNTSIAGFLFDAGNTSALLVSSGTNAQRANIGASGIMVNSGSGAVTIGGGTSQGLDLGADQVWTNNSGSLLTVRTISNMSNSTAYTLTLNGSGSGGITIGTGGITDGGTVGTTSIVNSYGGGVTTINGANTFTGGVKQNAGTLSIGNNAALGTGVFTINGGTIDVTGARTTTNNNTQSWNGDFTFNGTNTWDTGSGAVTMNASRTVTVSASTMTVSGGIGGAGFTLTKEGAGKLILNNATNSFGGVVLNNGTLGIFEANAFGTSPSGLTFGGNSTLQFQGSNGAWNSARSITINPGVVATIDTQAFNDHIDSAITGATGSLVKVGTGTLTLNASNTYGGGTTVSAGTLALVGSGTLGATTGNLTIGTLAAGSSGSLNLGGTSQTVGYVTINSTGAISNGTLTGTAYEGMNGTVSAVLAGSGVVLTKNGTGALILAATDLSKSVTTTNASATVTMADTTGISIGSYVTGTGITGGTYVTAISTNASVTLSANATASGAITAAFGVANTYSGGTILNSGTLRVGSSGTTTSSALGSGVLTIGEGTKLTSASATDYYLSNNVTVGGNFTTGETGFAGELNLTGNVSLGSQDRVITAIGASLEFQGDVSGSGGIIKEGTGTISFNSNPKSFTGNLTVNNGTVIIRSNSTAIGGATKTIFMNGGALSVYGAQSLTLDNPITVGGNFGLTGNVITLRGSMDLGAADRTITTTAGGNIISGNITGSGGLIVADSFTANATAGPSIILTGNNTFGGNLTLTNTAYVSVNRTAALGNGSTIFMNQNSVLNTTGNITTSKTIDMSGTAPNLSTATGTTLTLNGQITGTSASPEKSGAGTLVLNGANSFASGSIFLVSNGQLNLGNVAALNGTSLKFNPAGSSLDNTSGSDMTPSGLQGLLMTSGFTFVGTNNLNLSGGEAGFVQTNNSTRTISVTANTLTISGIRGTGTAVNSGVAFLDGALTKSGAGTLVIAGASSYTLGTSVTVGVLQTSTAASAFGTNATVNVGGSGTLSLRNNADVSFTNGTNPYTVTTTASGATVNVDRVSGTGNNTITIGDIGTTSTAATFVVNFTGANGTSLNAGALTTPTTASAAALTLNNNITGGGGLTLAGITAGTTNATGSTMTIGGTGNTTVSGAIAQQTGAPVALTKSGGGALVLNGTNTYTGSTTVNTGTLLINGSTSTSSVVTVNSGGTLGGNGTVGGDTTIASGGNLAPGNSPGVLTFSGNLTLSGTTTMEITGTTARGTDFDGINVGLKLTYGGDLNFIFGPGALGNTTINLFQFASREVGSVFASVNSTGFYSGTWTSSGDTWSLTSGGQTLTFDQFSGDLGIVPEPSTWLLAAFGLTTVVVFRRRRRD